MSSSSSSRTTCGASWRERPPTPPTPKPGETPEQALLRAQWLEDATELAENRRILAALLRSDVQVRGDFNPKIFHQKFVFRDYREKALPTSALLTGSANFTLTDTHRNLNHVFVFRNAYVCRQYETEVEQLRGSFGRGMHGDVPSTYDLAGVPVKVLFAPDHTPELEFMKQMLKVREDGEIWFAIFTFSGSSGIDVRSFRPRRLGWCDRRSCRRCDPCSPPLEIEAVDVNVTRTW
jgi:hypothetical protein